MPASSYRLEELLPHRPPMVLIDEVVAYDASARQLTTAVTIREEWSENYVAIEFMAQTAAALAGIFDRERNPAHPARPGFLLGTRKLSLALPRFEVGRRYLITATDEFNDDETASFRCEIADADDRIVATAMLNAYRPDDLKSFLQTQRGTPPDSEP